MGDRDRERQRRLIGEGECFLKEPVGDMVGGGSVGAGVGEVCSL